MTVTEVEMGAVQSWLRRLRGNLDGAQIANVDAWRRGESDQFRLSVTLLFLTTNVESPDKLSPSLVDDFERPDAWRLFAGTAAVLAEEVTEINRLEAGVQRRAVVASAETTSPNRVDQLVDKLAQKPCFTDVLKQQVKVRSESRVSFDLVGAVECNKSELPKLSEAEEVWEAAASQSDSSKTEDAGESSSESSTSGELKNSGKVTVHSKPTGTIVVDGVHTKIETPGTVRVTPATRDVQVRFDSGELSEPKEVTVSVGKRFRLFFRK